MRRRGSRDEAGRLSDAIAAAETPRDDAQCAEAGLGQLENGGRVRSDVAIHAPHLGADVAAGMTRELCDPARAIEPAKARESDAARISPHQERRVRRACYRRKR
jgi:hypothetical protein